MLMQRYISNPYELLRREIDGIFDDYSVPSHRRRAAPVARRAAFPAFNIWETEQGFSVEAECPGMKIGDLEITITGNQLSVAGSRSDEQTDGVSYHRRERGTGSFARAISLPVDVNGDGVEATLKDGVLRINLPKAESAKSRRIEVKG